MSMDNGHIVNFAIDAITSKEGNNGVCRNPVLVDALPDILVLSIEAHTTPATCLKSCSVCTLQPWASKLDKGAATYAQLFKEKLETGVLLALTYNLGNFVSPVALFAAALFQDTMYVGR